MTDTREALTVDSIREALSSQGYISNPRIEYALYGALLCGKPLLLEGAPGVGKTELGKALAGGLGLDFIRVQMYEGLTADQILYDYDYQKQLLTLEAIRPVLEKAYEGQTLEGAIQEASGRLDFYGEDFLLRRPLLKAISSGHRCALLLDELDKAPEEIEYMLYEFLEGYSISIPQYGTITCPEELRPYVFITSNGYRDLSGALKRRCNYLYLDPKTKEEVVAILQAKAEAKPEVAEGIACCMVRFQGANIRKMPSISEAVDFARFLSGQKKLTKELVLHSLSFLIKDRRDEALVSQIVSDEGKLIWSR